MTVTRICPGYSSSFSIRRAMSLARPCARASSTLLCSTMMRTSRPAWMAYDFSTPGNVAVIDGLADVVHQPGALGRLLVHADLGRHHAGEMGDLDRVVEDVLPV